MHLKKRNTTIPVSATGFVQWTLLLGISGAALLAAVWSLLDPEWFGAGRYKTHPIPLGEQMPELCDAIQDAPKRTPTAEGRATLVYWRERQLPNWRSHSKVTAPRVILAKLAENTDVEAVNRYLLAGRPTAGTGSNWKFHRGDYDFTLVTLTTILYMFGHDPERLYPETRRHLLAVLLNEEGGTPLVTVPRTFGLILDTENHHLMTEGSRYLKNQWLANYGTDEQQADPRYDNRENGLEAWLVEYLEEMIAEGVYEFNSLPYIGFTLQALLNLEAYPDAPDVRAAARYLLDVINSQYALGSLDLRRFPPFRRQYQQAHRTTMHTDPHTAFMRIWTGAPHRSEEAEIAAGHYSHFSLLAELLPYRLPRDVRAWTLEKPDEYFVRYGRGAAACPELYSGGPGYLLSAGGANRGWRSHIVARPITLLLDDGETDARRCFHISGHGNRHTWNNTGVYRRFAVANHPVHVPEQHQPLHTNGGWQIFRHGEARPLLIATYSAERVGIIALFPDWERDAEALLELLQAHNADSTELRHKFVWPNGRSLEYDPDARKGVWVMETDNGEALDRDYDHWPQLDGDVPALSFSRTR